MTTEEASGAPGSTAAAATMPGDLADPTAPQEVELKYAVRDVTALRAWIEASMVPGVVGGPWATRSDEDAYIDTDDRALAAAGYGARLRRRGSRITLTLKSLGSVLAREEDGNASPASAALHRRVEIEGPATRSNDPAAWPDSPARELLLGIIGMAQLRIRFVVQQRRNVRELCDENGQVAELSLDEATVRYRDVVAGSFTTLEIEAKGGSETLLSRLAAALEATGLVDPESRSKEAVAASMVQAEASPAASESVAEVEAPGSEVQDAGGGAPVSPPRPSRFAGVKVDDTLGAAGRKVLRMHMGRMLATEQGTRSGAEPEDLHKMRVATRRMRAAWRVFDGAYRPKLQRRYVRELRLVATALGIVRDLDVQRDGLAAYVATLPRAGARAMDPLVAEWDRRREEARVQLLALLDGKAYASFVRDYQAFVDTPEAGELKILPGAPTLVRDRAAGRIWGAYEAVRAHDTTLAWADVPALHALRIDAKRLRYALEFFREVLPDGADLLISRVTELQDHLGLLNDADVAAHLARDYLASHASRLPAASREAIGFYLASREAEIVRLRKLFPPIWRRLIGSPFRRTLAFTVAAL